MIRELQAEGHSRMIYLPKTRYSAFFATPLDAMLRARKVHHLTVTGVCTDICVLHTVIDAIYNHYSVAVVENCCATCIPHGQEWACLLYTSPPSSDSNSAIANSRGAKEKRCCFI